MNQVVQDALNRQITAEFSASYAYLAMAAYCERQNFTGSAHWLRIQSQEEHAHALKLFDFLLARNLQVVLQAIPQPRVDHASVVEVFASALAQEQEVSRQIDELYELAFREKAFAALVELQWFITEQVEEEKTAREVAARFRMLEHEPASLLDLDRELGQRQRTTGEGRPPASGNP